MAMDGVAGYILGSIAFFFFWVLAVFPNFPVLPIGRTSGALLGAALMVVFQIISPHEAYESLDLPILGLLFGTMVLSVYVESVGLFQHLGDLLSWGAPGPKSLLCRLCVLVAITSALFTNDTVCVAMTGFVLKLCRENRLPPEPFLLALATSANIGSAATPIGNPQNLVIAVEGNISFGAFSQKMLPSVTIGFFLNTIMLLLVYWKRLSTTLPPLPLPLQGEQTHLPTAPPEPFDAQTKNYNNYVYDYDYEGSFHNSGRVERAHDSKLYSSQPQGDSSILKSLSRRMSKDFDKSSRFSIMEKNKRIADISLVEHTTEGEENELNSEKIEMLKQSSLKSDDSILSFDNLLRERSQDFKSCSSQPQGDLGILKSLSKRTSKDFDRSSRFSITEKKNKTADIAIVEPTNHGEESQQDFEKVVVEMSKQPSLKSEGSILSEKSIGHFPYKGNAEAKYLTGSIERPQPFPVARYDSVSRSTFIEEVKTISKARLMLFKKIYVILITLGMLAALLYGLDMSWSAITAAVVLMVLDFKDSGPSLDKVSYSLLVFFSGMFIVVDGFNRTEIPGLLWSKVEPLARIDSITGVMMLTIVIIILSNVASNVPTVLLLGPQVVASAIALNASPTQAWLILAWVSTIAGNLTLLGSASNLIISEQAKRDNSSPGNLSCTRHLRFGPLSTCIVTFVGLPLIHWPRL